MGVGWSPGHLSVLACERKMLLFSLPGHSWDHTGWIELCTALISMTVQMGWVSSEGRQGGLGQLEHPSIPSTSVVMCLPV